MNDWNGAYRCGDRHTEITKARPFGAIAGDRTRDLMVLLRYGLSIEPTHLGATGGQVVEVEFVGGQPASSDTIKVRNGAVSNKRTKGEWKRSIVPSVYVAHQPELAVLVREVPRTAVQRLEVVSPTVTAGVCLDSHARRW